GLWRKPRSLAIRNSNGERRAASVGCWAFPCHLAFEGATLLRSPTPSNRITSCHPALEPILPGPPELPMSRTCRCIAMLVLLLLPLPALAQTESAFATTKPSGQPYLNPGESRQRLHVPMGWEVKVFAAEPDIITPVAFTVDERGRLWVVECYEYPSRTPPGKM